MEVKYENSFFLILQDLFFDVVYGRCGMFRWPFPDSIRIDAGEFSPGVAMDHPIRIDHRHYLEDIVIIETVIIVDCFDYTIQKMNDDPFQHVAGGSLDWMLPPQDPDDLA